MWQLREGVDKKMLKKKDFLAFFLPAYGGSLYKLSHPFEWVWIDQKTVSSLFSREERLQKVFKKILAKGFVGLAWHHRGEWISYACMSLPETLGPPHLPRYIRRLPVYWIFYCRTKKAYRGRGLYKASLSILCDWARKRDPKAEIYIDTEPSNVPSRKAIEAVGFTPAGIINVWTLKLPKLGSVVIGGSWNKEAKHLGVNI